MLKNLNEIELITSIGAGPIGGGWTAHFLSKGFRVNAYLHSRDEIETFNSILETAWVSLTELGLADGASLQNLEIFTNLEDSIRGTHFVQESAPEQHRQETALELILHRVSERL